MKQLCSAVTLVAALLPYSAVMAGETMLILGAGGSVMPAYEGSNKYLFSPTVDINYGYISDDYGVFSIGLEGAEWAIGLTDNFTFSSRIGYDAGRDEKIGILGNKNEDLKGMGDLDGSMTVGATVNYSINNYQLYVSADMATKDRHYGGRNIGRTVNVEIGGIGNYQINSKWDIEYTLATVWGNKAYNQAYFGVSKQQASRSRFNEYDAGSGFKDIHGGVILNYNLNEDTALYTGVGAYYLVGDAAKSTLTEQRLGWVGLAGIKYTF
ncbi:MipA/OmpV family protein [Providencia stuartii]|uniref:MipA/OmpV family protein n=1 Tax=Providencia stuartii TaxID=588 RepID=UPI00076B1C02|nr:MipA/OmpV family protein [Providencia stuartii]AMG65527.1 MipA/OmpV family protein [Providencia stuartii]